MGWGGLRSYPLLYKSSCDTAEQVVDCCCCGRNVGSSLYLYSSSISYFSCTCIDIIRIAAVCGVTEITHSNYYCCQELSFCPHGKLAPTLGPISGELELLLQHYRRSRLGRQLQNAT